MKFLIISGNPKQDGLCMSVQQEVLRGARDSGAQVSVLTVDKLERCRVCGEGWGICRNENRCAFGDDGFNDAHEEVKNADAYCFITPVYWGEMAESLKCFFDKLRRCEFGQNGALAGKKVLLIASPGGSGNGMVSCFNQMERFCQHTGATVFDFIGVNRWNSEYKRAAAYAAAKLLTADN